MISIPSFTSEELLLIASVADGVPGEWIERAREAGLDWIEFRIDRFSSADQKRVLEERARYADLPVLATLRTQQEGGEWAGSEKERLALFEAVLPDVEAADIELSSEEIREGVLEVAREFGKTTIVSFHDFEATPEFPALTECVNRARALGADAVKIATWCRDRTDLQTLARLTIEMSEEPLITIGMGPYGKASRVLLPALGSAATYTYLGKSTAPGQWTLEETVSLLQTLGLR